VTVPDASGFIDTNRQSHPDLPENQLFEDLRGVMAQLSPRDAELAATAKAILQWHSTHGFCATCGTASEVINAGWQRTCPACHAQHFPRTDPVVIMLVVRGNSLLLGRSAPWPEGMYSLLAGFVEPGEALEAAVRREVFEETGVTVGAVRYLASQPWPFPASLMFGCIAEATSDAITIDPAELEDAQWVTREELITVLAGQHPRIKPGRKGAIAHFLMTNWLADRLN
jgi:NAD+ diphosphatase